MSNYILGISKKQKIKEIHIADFFALEGKKKYKKIEIYDEKLIEHIAIKSLSDKYHKLLDFLKEIIEDSNSGIDSFKQCLDRIEKFRQILEVKYKKLIKKELYKNYLEYIMELSKYFSYKIIEYQEINKSNYHR